MGETDKVGKKLWRYMFSAVLIAGLPTGGLAQSEFDLDALLSKAAEIESPLARPFICGPDDLLADPMDQDNGVVRVVVKRVCLDPSVSGDTPMLVVDGTLYNPAQTRGLDVLPAYRLFQLQTGDVSLPALSSFELEMIPDFAGPLDPGDGRDFAVAFALTTPSRDWAFVHPAQAGPIRFPVVAGGTLVTGAELPGVLRPSIAVAQEESEITTDPTVAEPVPIPAETTVTEEVPQSCYSTGDDCIKLPASAFADIIPDWFSPSEFTSDPGDLLGPPGAAQGMTLSCGGEVVAVFGQRLLVDGPGVDLQIFSDEPLGSDLQVQVARTTGRWFDATPTKGNGGFDVSELPEADKGFDLVRLANNGTSCAAPSKGPKIDAIAAISGRPWIRVEQRDGYSDLSGYLISRNLGGGRITRLDQPPIDGVDPIFINWDPIALIDEDTNTSYRVHVKDLETPASFALTFAEGKTAKVAAVRIHSEQSQGFTFHPDRIAIYASMDGIVGPWEQVGLPLQANEDIFTEEFTFANPVKANAMRIDFFARENSESYREEFNQSIAQIDVVEVAESENYVSVLRGMKINALDVHRDGHLVSFTSQFDEGERGAFSVLLRSYESFWQPETASLPQEMTFAFLGHDLQLLDQVTLSMVAETPIPDDWSPIVRAEISTDVSPLKGFQSLGYMKADASTGQVKLTLNEPVPARYLKLVIVEPGISPFGVTAVTARGQYTRYVDASPVFHREVEAEDKDADTEIEPDNDLVNGATLLEANQTVTGRPGSNIDVDHYRFDITDPGISAVTLRLSGRPRVKVNVTLMDEAGNVLANSPASGTATEQELTWLLAPGSYTVALQQDAGTMALFIDNSLSLGPAIYDALDAAEEFISNKTPHEEMSLYSFNHAAIRLVERTSDVGVLTEAIETWRNSPDAGKGYGTTIYDSIRDGAAELADAGGNKAIVMFTDGADATSTLTPSMFWDEIGTISAPVFIVGYGADMELYFNEIGSKAGDAMRSIALATEGGFFPAPTPERLPAVFSNIADRVRERDGYEISYSVSTGLGELEVLEAGGKMVSSGVLGNVSVIFDASGSMKARTDAGRRRINVARSVLFDLLEQVPNEVPMGLWLYGHSLAAKPKSKSCRDVELLVNPAPLNRDQIKDAVKAISPKGQTPIGYTLSNVGDAIPEGQSGLVILLTDGEETCDAEADAAFNPDRVVQDLIDRGVDLRVNIVGFDVNDPKIQAELASVAERTGGNFFYGEGQDGLREAMVSAFTAPIDVLDDTGRVVASGLVGDGPISLPQGSYRIRISGSDFISERQQVTGGRATRLFLSQEASAVRVRVEDVEIGADYKTEFATPEASPDPNRGVFNPDARVPETMEELIFKTQDLLAKLGYDPGPLDGAMGSKTRRAAQSFLASNGPLPSGAPFDAQNNPTLLLWFELFAALAGGQGQ